MDLRIFIEPQQGASYDDQLRVAKAAEDLGFDAFFRSDHYLAMGGDGVPGPTDAWLTLAGLARETSRIRLGTLVSPATFRLPGRARDLGRAGRCDERRAGRTRHRGRLVRGRAPRLRRAVPGCGRALRPLREQVEIIDGLWRTPAGETYDFDGTHYQLSDSPALPKPVQSPRPPIVIGGSGKRRTAALAAHYADEFNVPFDRPGTGAAFDRVRAAAAQAGRELIYSAAQVLCVGRDEAELKRRAAAIDRDVDDLRETGLAGSPAEVVERIGKFAELGAARLYPQVLDRADLDHLELVSSEVAPQL